MQTGVDSILVTYSLLGLPFAVIRPIIALISGVFGGIFTNSYTKNEHINSQTTLTVAQEKKTEDNLFYRFYNYAFVEFLQDISKWLIIGLMLAALIALVLPNDFFTSYINNNMLSMGIVLLASVPLYVCATGSVPIAAVLLMKGLSPGAALVFLMAGPATNTATITVLGKVMGKKALAGYLVSIIGFALLFGFIIDYFLPREWFTSFISTGHSGHSEHGLPYWLQISSTIALILLIINGYYQKYKISVFCNKSGLIKVQKMETYKFLVKGMTCNHCKANVENAIKQVSGVNKVDANITNSVTTVEGDNINPDEIKKGVEGIGYVYGGIVN